MSNIKMITLNLAICALLLGSAVMNSDAAVTIILSQQSNYDPANHYGTAIKAGTNNVPILKISILDADAGDVLTELTFDYTGSMLLDIGVNARLYKGTMLVSQREMTSGRVTFPIGEIVMVGDTYYVTLDVVASAESNTVDLRFVSGKTAGGVDVIVGDGVIDPAGMAWIDKTPPSLLSATYDKGNKILALVFDDSPKPMGDINPRINVIDRNGDNHTIWRIDLSKLMLRKPDDSHPINLNGAMFLYPDSETPIPGSGANEARADMDTVKIRLTPDQDAMVQISLLSEIYINAGALTDYRFGNAIDSQQGNVDFIVDTVPPTLAGAPEDVTFNYHTKVLAIRFSEPIDAVPASDVDLSGLVVRSVSGLTTLSGASVAERYSTIVNITLTNAQRDILKDENPLLDIAAGALKDITGNGIDAISNVSVYVTPPEPNISVAPTSHDFGSVPIGSVSTPLVITISNMGDANLNISSTILSDTTNYSLDVSGDSNPCGSTSTLTPNSSCTVTVTFTPSAVETFDATLTINSTDPDTPSVSVSLTGIGEILFGDVSGDGNVTAYDAALILQYCVGLIDHFPVEEMSAAKRAVPAIYELRILSSSVKVDELIRVPIMISNGDGLTAGAFKIKYDSSVLRAVAITPRPMLNGAYWQSKIDEKAGEIRFAFAKSSPSKQSEDSALALLEFEQAGEVEGVTTELAFGDVQIAESISIKKVNGSITFLPRQSALLQNYPNPFNPETWIPYKLANSSKVTIYICNLKGEIIRIINLGTKTAGAYTTKNKAAYWNGRTQTGEPSSSGLYLYTIKASNFTATRKMILLK